MTSRRKTSIMAKRYEGFDEHSKERRKVHLIPFQERRKERAGFGSSKPETPSRAGRRDNERSGQMGFFSWGGEAHPCQVPGYLSARACRKLEKQMYGKGQVPAKSRWLLSFAAPMLAKDGQRADGYPHYTDKRYDQMKKAFENSWGSASESTVQKQLERMLQAPCASELDPILRIFREFPQSQWEGQLSRAGRFSEKQFSRAAEFSGYERRFRAYGLPWPEGTLFAYDLCRAGNMICIAVGLEAVRPVNAPDYLGQVAWAASQYYSAWEEYYAAYAAGRVLWHWKQEQLLAMKSTTDLNCCRLLLKSPKSVCGEMEFTQYLTECPQPETLYHP